MDQFLLIGLDFGSTTSSAIISRARVLRNCSTGRMELGQPSIVYRSSLTFTPFVDNLIDERILAGHLDRWIGESGVTPESFASGGVIITGLAAQKSNVAAIETLVKQRVSEALFAVAEDPSLESWLAFMGSCLPLSCAEPQTHFLNLDIGGGTTNLALGINGDVLRCGSLYAGARHFQFVPGTYRITALSPYAVRLLEDLDINRSIGDTFSQDELRSILDFYAALIEAAVCADRSRLDQNPFRYHEQMPFIPPRDDISPVITLSGGVGELIYNHVRGEPLPARTAFGDLGIDLAMRLMQSPLLSQHLRTHAPVNFGHATVYGLSLYGTQVSGTTLYLPDPRVLPLRDLPIVARLGMDASAEDIRQAVDMAGRGMRGGCIEIDGGGTDFATVKKFGAGLASALRETGFPVHRSLVLLVPNNVGKTVGSYASDWGRLPVKLIVIDELASRNSRFASLGVMRDNVVPVSFYGMQ
jgi:ethanolamine utilization protein EutA